VTYLVVSVQALASASVARSTNQASVSLAVFAIYDTAIFLVPHELASYIGTKSFALFNTVTVVCQFTSKGGVANMGADVAPCDCRYVQLPHSDTVVSTQELLVYIILLVARPVLVHQEAFNLLDQRLVTSSCMSSTIEATIFRYILSPVSNAVGESPSNHLVTVRVSVDLLVTSIFSLASIGVVSSHVVVYLTSVAMKFALGNLAPFQDSRLIVVVTALIPHNRLPYALSFTWYFWNAIWVYN
jgi:hypothetical protein